MIPFYQPKGPSELLPRYACLEPLFEGARILEVGAVASTGGRSAAFLRERGARFVLAIDVDADAIDRARREWASDGELRFRAATPDSLEETDFDLVLVADAAPLVRDPRGLNVLAQLAGETGRVVLALRNPAGVSLAQIAVDGDTGEAPTWGEMLERLRERFPSIEVLAQGALFGYQFVPLAAGEDAEVAVDGSLLDAEECAYVVAICGARPTGAFDAISLVAVPAAPLAISAGRRDELAGRLRLAEQAVRDAAEPAQTLRSELEARVAQLADELQQVTAQLDEERRRARAAEDRADAAEAELRARPAADAPAGPDAEAATRISELERKLAAAEDERRRAAVRLDTEQARSRQLEPTAVEHSASARAAREALQAEAERARFAEAEAADAATRHQELLAALDAANARAGRLERDVETISGLERAARQRAEAAEAKLAESASAPPPGPAAPADAELADARKHIADLEEEARVLEASIAEAEQLAESRARTVAELEARLAALEAGTSGGQTPPADGSRA